jgi:hypothetical protein
MSDETLEVTAVAVLSQMDDRHVNRAVHQLYEPVSLPHSWKVGFCMLYLMQLACGTAALLNPSWMRYELETEDGTLRTRHECWPCALTHREQARTKRTRSLDWHDSATT